MFYLEFLTTVKVFSCTDRALSKSMSLWGTSAESLCAVVLWTSSSCDLMGRWVPWVSFTFPHSFPLIFLQLNHSKWVVFEFANSFFYVIKSDIEPFWWISEHSSCILQCQNIFGSFSYFLSVCWHSFFSRIFSLISLILFSCIALILKVIMSNYLSIHRSLFI